MIIVSGGGMLITQVWSLHIETIFQVITMYMIQNNILINFSGKNTERKQPKSFHRKRERFGKHNVCMSQKFI